MMTTALVRHFMHELFLSGAWEVISSRKQLHLQPGFSHTVPSHLIPANNGSIIHMEVTGAQFDDGNSSCWQLHARDIPQWCIRGHFIAPTAAFAARIFTRLSIACHTGK